ncbi:hypothetical protein PISMIDRAFT_686624 [Pisolithus microcarpus 441]|uniref:Uncharacterized protein n=1 Tax=Pisolithus microcarpus 441 TaxID=765257 RepID=A0A0C9XUN9_9AGAM|nr:hypothetical protein PISMIDRAFT_686624 [Pisolithus microcarpus 441]
MLPVSSLPIEVIEIPTSDSDEDGSGLFSSPKAPLRPTKAPEQAPADRKRKRKVVISDDDDDDELLMPAAISLPEPSHRSGTRSTKASPATEKSANKRDSCSNTPIPPEPLPVLDPSTPVRRPASSKPKSTAMGDLIRRVNSQPSSPFSNAGRTYSPLLKSSRTMLSRIASLHPTRRTPPPPPPRPPPPKKSKKQIELEERIEEELAETIEGWSCMTEEERKELRRARIDAELGYE